MKATNYVRRVELAEGGNAVVPTYVRTYLLNPSRAGMEGIASERSRSSNTAIYSVGPAFPAHSTQSTAVTHRLCELMVAGRLFGIWSGHSSIYFCDRCCTHPDVGMYAVGPIATSFGFTSRHCWRCSAPPPPGTHSWIAVDPAGKPWGQGGLIRHLGRHDWGGRGEGEGEAGARFSVVCWVPTGLETCLVGVNVHCFVCIYTSSYSSCRTFVVSKVACCVGEEVCRCTFVSRTLCFRYRVVTGDNQTISQGCPVRRLCGGFEL